MIDAIASKNHKNHFNYLLICNILVGNDTPQTMADPWNNVPELRLNLCVYMLSMVGGLVGNLLVIIIMIRSFYSKLLKFTYFFKGCLKPTKWKKIDINLQIFKMQAENEQKIQLRYLENQPFLAFFISKFKNSLSRNNLKFFWRYPICCWLWWLFQHSYCITSQFRYWLCHEIQPYVTISLDFNYVKP